jgi:CMP-N-acetylneuraminic acid synthetase
MFDNCYFLIPAREGSKGFPHKNRKLFDYTAQTLPKHMVDRVYVTTDDYVVKQKAKEYNFHIVDRPLSLAGDSASLKPVLQHFVQSQDIDGNSLIVLLFLTYPQRSWEDIEKIINFFETSGANSLICAEEVKEHPYLCFYDLGNHKGQLVIDHKFYRRQDYPKCFKQSMYVGCYRASVIDDLHDLLVEKETIFYKLETTKIDVDYEEDYNDTKSR